MPNIPPAHLLGSRAIAEVQSILARSGALSEIVKNDYGEDLLVQTHENGEADPFRILVQVKGASRLQRNKRGEKIFRFRLDHLFRWISQIGSTLICIYEEESGVVYAADPKGYFTLWDLGVAHTRTKAIVLPDESLFNIETAKSIIWLSRIQYYSDLLAIAENKQRYLEHAGASKSHWRRAGRDLGVISLNFLKMIGFLVGDEIKELVRRQFRNGASYFSENFNDDGSLSLRDLMMFIIIGEVNDVTGQGVPANLLEHATELAGHMYKLTYPEEWELAGEHFQRRWIPFRAIEISET